MSERKNWKSLLFKKGEASIHRRIYLLFFVIVLLFTVILLRLAQMQLADKNFYVKKLKASTTYTVKTSSLRGQIYDATGTALVTNEEKQVVTFTRSNTMTAADIKKTAKVLSVYVDLTETQVSDRAKRDYYLADSSVYKKVVESLPRKKKYDSYGNNLTESTIYNNAVAAVPDSAVAYSDDELKLVYIFNQMNSVSTFNSVNLTTGTLTANQIAYLTANQKKLPGITVTSSWDRQSSDSSLSDIMGTISSEKAGLPQEEADAYLKKGYSLNDRVGTSYLEKQYEDSLQGTHTVRTIKVNKKGKIVSNKLTAKGSRGKNLKLTINSGFQTSVENILNQYYNSELSSGNANYSEGVYAVALEPSTGKILAMAGRSHEQGQLSTEEDNIGTINNTYTPGSVVKGATISSGWENGVLSGNEVLYDQEIAGIKSWFTKGLTPITAAQALEYSSNTYMVQVALRLMGQNYTTSSAMTTSGYKEAMEKLRNTYAEYGLGTSTGIDLPESEGYLPKDFEMNNVLFEAFGQYDGYTPMQLAQYGATVANNGNRVSPHIVDGIYDSNENGDLGNLLQTVDGKTLNKVNISDDEMGIVQQGFYNVVNSSSGYATGTSLRSSVTTISGKTGTAETFATSASGTTVATVNLNVIAYDADRKIAVSVMYPHAADDETKAHQLIARDIINLYLSNYAGGN